jgi:hypothetical protein
MMKRVKGATLAEIIEATGWQAHTVRGFVSILGSKGGEKVESSKTAAGSAATTSRMPAAVASNAPSGSSRGGVAAFCGGHPDRQSG